MGCSHIKYEPTKKHHQSNTKKHHQSNTKNHKQEDQKINQRQQKLYTNLQITKQQISFIQYENVGQANLHQKPFYCEICHQKHFVRKKLQGIEQMCKNCNGYGILKQRNLPFGKCPTCDNKSIEWIICTVCRGEGCLKH